MDDGIGTPEVSPEERLNARERAVALREMQLQARDALRERSLPEALSGALSYESPEALMRSVDAAEAAFRQAVERGVQDRMRGDAPARAQPQRDAADMTDDDYYKVFCRAGGR